MVLPKLNVKFNYWLTAGVKKKWKITKKRKYITGVHSTHDSIFYISTQRFNIFSTAMKSLGFPWTLHMTH